MDDVAESESRLGQYTSGISPDGRMLPHEGLLVGNGGTVAVMMVLESLLWLRMANSL